MSTVSTLGHGNRSLDELLALLHEAGVACMVDVRAHPASRRHPQFAGTSLERALGARRIRYVWEGRELGGFRKPRPDSPHAALESEGFRGFADHMQTEGFIAAAGRVLALAAESPTGLLCAERDPLHCHRSLIADYLVARGARVMHLLGTGEVRAHVLSPLARLEGATLIYDGGTQPLF